MSNISQLYNSISGFLDGHRMVQEFKLLGSVDELDAVNYKPRSVFLVVDSTDISRENNLVGVNCSIIVLDKSFKNNPESLILSLQENVFVIGQVQDFILSEDHTCEFFEISTTTADQSEYTTTAAVCRFSVYFDRGIFNDSCFEGDTI